MPARQMLFLGFVLKLLFLYRSSAKCTHGGTTPTSTAVPPEQYPIQVAVMQNWSAIAAKESAAKTPQLLEILNTVAMREMINQTCPELYTKPAEIVLQRILDELSVSELVHTFGSECNNEGATSLQNYAAAPYFYSLWHAYYLELSRGSRFPEDILNNAEVREFKLPAFSRPRKKKPLERYPSTFEEAGSRLIYTALNYAKTAGPNNGFGDIMMLFNRTHVRNMVAISPMDTGDFCHKVKEPKKHKKPDCAAWDRSMGTLDHLNHLIVYKYLLSWGNSTYDPETKRSTHLFPTIVCGCARDPTCDKHYAAQTRIHGWPFKYPYMEANILANPIYPYGVQAIVASFDSLFGTAEGDLVRSWAMTHGWPLFWSHAAAGTGSDMTLAPNVRLLDPVVLAHSRAGHNYTIRANDSLAFNTILATAKTTKHRKENYTKFWSVLLRGENATTTYTPTTLAVLPLSAYQCEAPERCVAVSQSSLSCICVQ